MYRLAGAGRPTSQRRAAASPRPRGCRVRELVLGTHARVTAAAQRIAERCMHMSAPTVAIIGASADRTKYGNKAVRAHAMRGWLVFPVNPRGGLIEGFTVYKSLAEIPVPVERISLYVPPALGLRLLPAIAAARPRELFVNPGAESEELVRAARDLGLAPRLACSIVDLGESPADYPP